MSTRVRDLFHQWGPGAESGKRFGRLVDLLLYQEARAEKKRHFLFDDRAGDYHGLDSFRGGPRDPDGTIGYQYKFYPSPLTPQQRGDIEDSLRKAVEGAEKLRLRKWVLVSPQDLVSPATRKGGGDVEWFESLREKHCPDIELEHIGHSKLTGLLQIPESILLCLHYYPELAPANLRPLQRTIQDTRECYDRAFAGRHARLRLVGFPALKDPLDGFPIEQIYVPLAVTPSGGEQQTVNPVDLLAPGARSVIVGDPGSGKSTLLRFLALAGIHAPVGKKYGTGADTERLPVIVTLRRYVDELKKPGRDIPLLEYITSNLQADLSLNTADTKFLERYLENRQAILLFDGLDELADPDYKEKVRDRIKSLWEVYPGNTVIVTSRIVGYDSPFRFDDSDCRHFRLLALNDQQIERFVGDWYQLRYPGDPAQRGEGINSLMQILRDPDKSAIHDLAENPLLLTLIALVHRSEATLPDKRVVLYEKCVELLLHTWHGQIQGRDARDPSNTDARNRRWLEEIANWMQEAETDGQRALALKPYDELLEFLTGVVGSDQRVEKETAKTEAREFLKFVRKRAGLLVESGDRQYSFVHLTFQEYLTASQRVRLMEDTGFEAQRSALLSRCAEPRWHEVIRLWIASLKAPRRQEEAIGSILACDGAEAALLAGGALLDSVEAARWCGEDIVRRLLWECCQKAEEDLPALLGLLRRWLGKEVGHAELLWRSLPRDVDPVALGLCLSALEALDPKATVAWVKRTIPPGLQLPFCLLLPDLAVPEEAEDERRRLSRSFRAMQSHLLIHGFGAVPAFMLPIEIFLLRDDPAALLFKVGLQSLLTLGSFNDLAFARLLDLAPIGAPLARLLNAAPARDLDLALTRARLGMNLDPNRALNLNLDLALTRARVRALVLDLDLARVWDLTRNLDQIPDYVETVWMLACPALWREALRVRFVSQLPARAASLANEASVASIRDRLPAGGTANEDTAFHAGWLILHAILIELYLPDHLKDRKAELLALTRDNPHPALRIAHCINSIAEGDKGGIEELRGMVKSEDPAYKQIFVDACWRDP